MKKFKKHFLSLIIFIFLAVILTMPLSLNISTHIPGYANTDAGVFLWNTWWLKYSLVDLGQNPYNATTIFYPNGSSLAFHTFNPIQNIIAFPLQFIVSVITAFNLVFLLGIVLSGFVAYCLAYYLTKNWWASMLAGYIFAFNPAVTARATAHFNLTTTWLIPLFILIMLCIHREFKINFEKKTKDNVNIFKSKKLVLFIVLGGVIIGLQYWNDLHYFLYLIIFLFIFFIYNMYNYFSFYYLKKAIFLGVIFFASFIFIIAPLFIHQFNEINNNDYFGDNETYTNQFIPDSVRFFTPSWQSTFLSGADQFIEDNFQLHQGEDKLYDVPYLGYSLIILAIFAFRGTINKFTKKERGGWALVALIFLLLSFGPTLYIFNKPFLNNLMPYSLIAKTPILNNIRVPSRAIIMVFLGLSVLAAYGIAQLKNRKYFYKFLIIIAFIGISLEYTALPFDIFKIEMPEIYNLIEDDGSTLFEIPFYASSALEYRSGYKMASDTTTYQIWHKHNLLNGYLSRASAETIYYYRELESLHCLLFPFNFSQEEYSLTPMLFDDLKELNINYIIFHQDVIEKECSEFCENFEADKFKEYISKFTELIKEENGIYLYKVDYSRKSEL